MTQVSEHLNRWTTASINKHFENILSPAGYYRYYEGMSNRQTQRHEDYFEIRYDGPHLTEWSKADWELYIEVNILATVKQDSSAYQIDVLSGLLVNAFTAGPIGIYKLGNGAQDDGSLIGCIYLLQEKRNKLEVNRLGRIHQDKRLLQCMVEGHYSGQLELPS